MADALSVRVKQLVDYIEKFNLSSGKFANFDASEWFDGLMNHLRKMMIGYETEQVQVLLKQMEEVVAGEAWYRHQDTLMDKVIVICEQLCNIRYNSNIGIEEAVVGFHNEVEILLNQLTRNSAKKSLGYCFKKSNLRFEAVDAKVKVSKSYDGLMNHLRNMMIGYETEQVQVLLKQMEAWYSHEETVMDRRMAYKHMQFVHKYTDIDELRKVRLVWCDEKIGFDKMIVICEQLCNIRYNSNIEGDEAVVGFDNEVEVLLNQLTGTSAKQFQVVSIAGTAGLGKTTLARKLYRDPLIEYMFDFRAWACVSQAYVKEDLLLTILSSFIDDMPDEFYRMHDHQLGEKLYRKLKGRKYLVVFDDIWDYKVWNDLKMYFPDDQTGSRVLFTSRDIDVSLHVQSARPAHVLRLRTEVESRDIFVKMVFRFGVCPVGLEELGWVIIRKCEGLPLAIVIAAGLLKNNLSFTWWEQIAASLRSFMVSDPSQYMDSLALSYNHLPSHLRPCFLYFGAFPEDYEICATKLIWLWVAQGFINDAGSRIWEDVAEDFLKDLIKQSLVMTPGIKADGRVKTCRIHDLLHDFTLRKAQEENFMSNIYSYGMVSSMLCSPLEVGRVLQEGGSVITETYKLLRVLDMESLSVSVFPSEITRLVNLRYLSIQADDGSPQASISNLVNLQMMILLSKKNVILPKPIWNMVNLRHLYIKTGENLIEETGSVQVIENDGCLSGLASLQTLSQVSPLSCSNICSRAPNLRKLGFCGPLISRLGDMEFPNLSSLVHLQKLKLFNTFSHPELTRSCNPIMFPENLKKLTLSNTGMDWEEMWTFSLLPSLEILKLKFQACIGERWETRDAEFLKLKVLKLHDLNMMQWVSSQDNFPRLQRLVVHRCLKLNTIPRALGQIYTLEAIEVNGCNISVYKSAMEIQKEQESDGNCFLKVHAKEIVKIPRILKRA